MNYITYTPVKDVCEYLCIAVLTDRKSLEKLSVHFIRNLKIDSTIYRGHLDNEGIKKRIEGRTERVTIKFKRKDYEAIYHLGYALDCSPSRVVAVLLETAMVNMNIVNEYIKQYLQRELSDSQMKELKNLLRYINKESGSHYSWASLLSKIYDEVGSPMVKLKDAMDDFLKR